jgi:hypothetical protein
MQAGENASEGSLLNRICSFDQVWNILNFISENRQKFIALSAVSKITNGTRCFLPVSDNLTMAPTHEFYGCQWMSRFIIRTPFS